MNKIFKVFLIIFILFGFAFIPLNQAFAMKWNRSLVMIYIPQDETYAPKMRQAIAEWQKYTKKMSIMTTSQKRDLPLVEVETEFNKLIGENVKNSCSVSFAYSSNYFRHAKIVININETPEVLADSDKKQENDDEIYTVMLKSVGNMLGVPQSDDKRSVMYSCYEKGQKILPSDVDNFMNVYGWPVKKTN